MLTRRRRNTEHHESWDVLSGDVTIGRLSKMIGLESSTHWEWTCGFYPGCDKRTQQSAGTKPTFDEAKAALQVAWDQLEPQITPEMVDEWRKHKAYTAWKYAMRDARCQLPTATISRRSKCFCGTDLGIDDVVDHVYAKHMKVPEAA